MFLAMGLAQITTLIIGLTAAVTALGGLVAAIVSLYGKAKDALGQLKAVQTRLDDHSRRITTNSQEITEVALKVDPNKPPVA